MHIEIAQAVEFLGRLLQSKVDQDVVTSFKQTLNEILRVRFEHHWDPQQPFRGNGYRALSNFNGQLDPILESASLQASIQPNVIHVALPRDFVLWIDPFSVSYRVGDHGNIMTLFEDRSRGRVTLKMDNSTTTTTTITPIQQPTTPTSPNGSPSMQYLATPRTTNSIRISPPNSPESITLFKHQQHTPSPLAAPSSNNKKQEKKGLVLAN